MTATGTATGTGYDIEYTGPYSTYMPVGSGPSTYNGFSSFGFVSTPSSGFTLPAGQGVLANGTGVSSLSLQLYNTATSGKYAPAAGTFGIYVLPDNDTNNGGPANIGTGSLLFGGANPTEGGTQVGTAALGSTFGTKDNLSLNVASDTNPVAPPAVGTFNSPELLGTFSVTTSLPSGYSTFTVSGFSAAAQNIIANDIDAYISGSSSTPVDLAVVSLDNTGHVDWDGAFSGQSPLVQLNVTTTPVASSETFSVGSYASGTGGVTVNQNADDGKVLIDVTRIGYAGDNATLNYSLTNGNSVTSGIATNGTDYGTGAATGSVTFPAGQTQAEISVPISSVTPFSGTKGFSLALTTASTDTGATTHVVAPTGAAVTIVGSASLSTNFVPATAASDIETTGVYPSTYGPVNGSASNGSYGYQSFETYEFDAASTPSIFPAAGSQVSTLSNISFQMYNTATTGGYGGQAGDFNLYYVPATTAAAPTSGFAFQPPPDGVNGQGGAILLGTFSFTNNAVGFDTFTPVLSAAVTNDLINSLNAATPIRFFAAPGSANFAADWDGVYSGQTPQVSLTDTVITPKFPERFTFDPSNTYAAAEGSNVNVVVDRTADTADGKTLTDGATLQWSLADGNALAGTNYSGPTSGTVTFPTPVAGTTTQSETISIPTIAVNPQNGDKAFTIILTNPVVGDTTDYVPVLGFGAQSAPSLSQVLTVTDTGSGSRETLQNYDSDYSTIEHDGPYSTTYLNVAGDGSSKGYPSYAALNFNDASVEGPNGPDSLVPTNTPVTAINSVTLLVSQAYPVQGTSGPLDVYLVPDASTNIDPSDPQSANPHFFDYSSEPNGFGTQFGTPMLLGHVNWDATVAGDTQVPLKLIDYNQTTENTLISDLNGGTKFRIIVASGNSGTGSVYASLEGHYTFDGVIEDPQIAINVTEGGSVSTLPPWLAPGSAATWDGTTLTVTGNATIIADPGSDMPLIVASGGSAKLQIAPTNSDTLIHLGGFNLSNGASVDVPSLGVNRTTDHHIVLEVGTVGGAAPTFLIDASSKLDMEDNDMILHSMAGSYSSVFSKSLVGRDGGAWDGNELTSSAAKQFDAENGGEYTALAVQPNDFTFLGNADASSFHDDGQDIALKPDQDIIVKYTYIGDFNLDGKVDFQDAGILGLGYDPAPADAGIYDWGVGDTNFDGSVNFTDAGAFGNLYYGLGTAASGLPQL